MLKMPPRRLQQRGDLGDIAACFFVKSARVRRAEVVRASRSRAARGRFLVRRLIRCDQSTRAVD